MGRMRLMGLLLVDQRRGMGELGEYLVWRGGGRWNVEIERIGGVVDG